MTTKTAQVESTHVTQLREHLIELLQGGNAHAGFDDAVKDMPENLRGAKPNGLPHSPWMLLEHLRIAQSDILDFCCNPQYTAPKWPEEYWPAADAPPEKSAWDDSVRHFRTDRKALEELVSESKNDLYAKIPWGDGQTILREAMLVADHNAYHVAQLIDVRRLLGAWQG